MKKIYIFIFIVFLANLFFAQSRITHNNRELFLNGSNVAWFDYSKDLGPSPANTVLINQFFSEFHASGGNVFRLWLHNDAVYTPEFNSDSLVVGPGVNAIARLKTILDLAEQNNISLQLCLFGFNLQRKSIGEPYLSRNKKLLTDTVAIRSYINNALIPMLNAVKDHPAIFAWEVFNEPEGMSNEFGWGDINHVPMSAIQTFINKVAGAIHRNDPSAKVTNGANRINTCSDVSSLAKVSARSILNSLNDDQKSELEQLYKVKYGFDLTAKQIIDHYYANLAGNTNYYRNDRLIAAGGDAYGTLDFYNIHFYNDGGTALSPFHHPYSFWNLDKPLVVAEFYMTDSPNPVVSYKDLYKKLYDTGYAGALSWHWLGDTKANDDAKNNNHARTTAAMLDIYQNHPNDIVLNPVTGTIYTFKAAPDTIDAGDASELKWITAAGSSPKLDNQEVLFEGSRIVSPAVNTIYTLTTNNNVSETATVEVVVLKSGHIKYFTAFPKVVESGEKVLLKWASSKGSVLKLNDNAVDYIDSVFMTVDATTTYKLIASGTANDTAEVTVTVKPVDQVNRALNRSVIVSSGTAGHDNPQFLVDGSFSTYWNSDPSESQTVQVDLLKPYSVNKIVLKWGVDYAKDYGIAKSTNKIIWKTFHMKNSAAGGVETIQIAGDTLRHLKLMLNESANGNGYILREFEVYGTGIVTDVNEPAPMVQTYRLDQNYPNPFNPATTIRYSIPEKSFVNLEVYNILGNRIAVLVNEYKNPGEFSIHFDGSRLSSGVYYYRLKTDKYVKTGKMLLLK